MKTWFGEEICNIEYIEYIECLNELEYVTIARCPICSELFEKVSVEDYRKHLRSHLI